MTKGQQSPLRPKRLRHVFRSACNYAGIVDDMVRVFLGQSGMSSKIYLGKSKQELEFFYNLVEPKITVYEDENKIEPEQIVKLNERIKKQDDKIERLQQESELNRRINELQRDMKESSIYTSDAKKYDELSDTAEKIKSKLAILRQKE